MSWIAWPLNFLQAVLAVLSTHGFKESLKEGLKEGARNYLPLSLLCVIAGDVLGCPCPSIFFPLRMLDLLLDT